MTDDEARQLLIDAGVPTEQINSQAIIIASVLGDTFARVLTRMLVDKFITTHVRFSPERPEGAVDYQFIKCACGMLEMRFNQLPITHCPRCSDPLADEWPDHVG